MEHQFLGLWMPQSFSEIKRISVRDDQGHAVSNINELEYVHREIYANIWQTDKDCPHFSANREDLGYRFERVNR